MAIESNRFLVFLSYVSTDVAVVAEIAAELEGRGVSCFYAARDIPDSREWLPTIEEALRACDALVAFVREEFRSSAWTDQEVGYALGRQKQVVPVMLEASWLPHGFFARYQAISGATNSQIIAQRIYD